MFLPTNITLKFGDSGDFVHELQRRLSIIHCFSADAINGFYDGNTVNGVSQFQSMSGIRADGIAGPETLRRLNGAISGEPYTEDHKTAEEHQQAAYQQHQDLLMQQQMLDQQLLEQQRLAEQQFLQQQPHQPPASYAPQPSPTYESQQPVYQQQASYAPQPQQLQPQQHPQPVAPAAADMLAHMLQQQQPAAQPQAMQQPAPQPVYPPQAGYAAQPPSYAAAPQPMAAAAATTPAYAPPQAAYQQPAPQQPLQTAPQPTAAYQPPQATESQQGSPATPEPSRGLVGRAVQYANEMVGKLAAYFEAKLPRHVVDEVKQIGHVMAASGMKEAPIPSGPEQQRDRGIEQQRAQQQGRQIS